MSDVVKLLKENHGDNFRVWNLSEKETAEDMVHSVFDPACPNASASWITKLNGLPLWTTTRLLLPFTAKLLIVSLFGCAVRSTTWQLSTVLVEREELVRLSSDSFFFF